MCSMGKSELCHSLPGWSLARGSKDLGTLLLAAVTFPGEPGSVLGGFSQVQVRGH